MHPACRVENRSSGKRGPAPIGAGPLRACAPEYEPEALGTDRDFQENAKGGKKKSVSDAAKPWGAKARSDAPKRRKSHTLDQHDQPGQGTAEKADKY